MWHALHIAFMVGHTAVVIFLVAGWMTRHSRPWHLAACLMTAASWLLLGLRYGFGYCFLTDWHWMVRERLGHDDLPNSFIKYLFDTVSGRDWDPALISNISVATFSLVCVLTLVLNARDWRQRRRSA